MKLPYYIFSVLIFLLIISVVGCGNENEGSGFSKNEDYLQYFLTDEVLGIVLLGDYYLLPTSLNHFLENGWQPIAGSSLRYEDLNSLIIPSGAIVGIRLVKNNMYLSLDVINAENRDIAFADATVSWLRTAGAKKDQAVIIGGITINTSTEDVVERLQYLNVTYNQVRRSRVYISDVNHYDGRLWIELDRNTVYAFSVRLGEEYAQDNFVAYFPEPTDQALEAAFMWASYYFEGIVIGIYYVERQVGRDGTIASGTTIVSRDSDGNLFAMRSIGRIDFADIQSGDTIKVYYGRTEHRGLNHEMIEYADGSKIPYVWADVLVINGEVRYSLFRR